MYVTVEARLIVDDPARSDARDRADILLHAGGEYRRNVDSDIGDATTLRTIGAGRFKRVTGEWCPFSMISVSADQARRTPPPGD